MSPEIPGRCTKCRRAVAAPGFLDPGWAQNMRINDVRVSCPDPDCGGWVQIIDGTFNVTDGAIEMLSGPQWSWDLVDELRLALVRAVESGTDPGDELQKVDPRAARSWRAAMFGQPESFRRKVAAFLLGSVLADYDVVHDNVEDVIKAMTEVLRFIAENGHLPGS